MNSVNLQIQRTISEAIIKQVILKFKPLFASDLGLYPRKNGTEAAQEMSSPVIQFVMRMGRAFMTMAILSSLITTLWLLGDVRLPITLELEVYFIRVTVFERLSFEMQKDACYL